MTKLVQICASQNDLFGLDDDGIVYQYNFSTSDWKPLRRARTGRMGGSAAGSDEPLDGQSGSRTPRGGSPRA
jgi:hypothetical protein